MVHGGWGVLVFQVGGVVVFFCTLPRCHTLPETNIAAENGWLEDEFPFGKASCKVLCLFAVLLAFEQMFLLGLGTHQKSHPPKTCLRGISRWWVLNDFLIFTRSFGEHDPNLTRKSFSNGCLKPPTRFLVV